MKKLIGIALIIAVITSLALGTVALADDPDEVQVDWDGTGSVTGSVDTGDSYSYFSSWGTDHTGTFYAKDSNNNPYNYGVDSCVFSLEDTIDGTGQAMLYVNRLTSKESMYGAPGQESYTYVGVEDGLATLQNRSSTNYASMKDCNYGWHATDHIKVTDASYFELQRYMNSGAGNYAEINAMGAGDVDLDCMSSEASEGQVRLGWGCGCGPYSAYDGFNADGSGMVELYAQGNNSATTAAMPGMTGADSFDIIATWSGGAFSIPDYYITAN